MSVMASVLVTVNSALQELGLPQVATVVSAQDDQTGFQTLGLVNALGTQMVKAHDWQQLMFTQEFFGDGITDEFDMPANFGRIVNQTEWSSKMGRPMFGPISPQGWSWIEFGIVAPIGGYRYRILQNKLKVAPVPAAGEKINFYYISRNWVYDPVTLLFKDKITEDDDEPIFDNYLMIAGVKMKLWAAKGMNATELNREFEFMISAEKAQTQGAAVIALDRAVDPMLLSVRNIQDGNWNV
jgi:hypothetical protein